MKHHIQSGYRIFLIALLSILPAVLGCEVENTKTVNCLEQDCLASCETNGQTGSCVPRDGKEVCICSGPDGGSYEWLTPPGDTDIPTDTSMDAGSMDAGGVPDNPDAGEPDAG